MSDPVSQVLDSINTLRRHYPEAKAFRVVVHPDAALWVRRLKLAKACRLAGCRVTVEYELTIGRDMVQVKPD